MLCRVMDRRFEVEDEVRKEYRRFNAVVSELTVRLLPPADGADPVTHFLASVCELFEYALQCVGDSDMVGVWIESEVNWSGQPFGMSFRWRDQVSADLWGVLERVSQSDLGFNALDRLVMNVQWVKMAVGFGGGVKTEGRPVSVMAHLKKSIVRV